LKEEKNKKNMLKLAVLCFLAAVAYGAYYEETVGRWVNKINSQRSSFRAGYNPFLAGKSFTQMQRLMGTKMDGNSFSRAPLKTITPSFALAKKFTSGEDKWPNCKSTFFFIKDQADCGSCWAVAASEVAADRTCIANYGQMAPATKLNEAQPPIDMSAADIMDCCEYCGDGCQGGYPIDAMKFWAWTGVVTGGWYGSNCGCYPYEIPPCPAAGCSGPEANTPACSNTCRRGYGKSFTADKHMASDHYEINGDARSIQQEINDNGPVECAFDVYENFMHYTSGVYDHEEGQYMGGHAVKIVGWGVEGGKDYWLINNSWNVTWGLTGQFKFLRGTNLCGMEGQCVAGLAKTGDTSFKLTC
jgi:cathepsin B